MGVRPKVSKGRSESPLVASAEAKSPACNNMLFFSDTQTCLHYHTGHCHTSRGLSDRPLDSFGSRLPCRWSCIARLYSYWQGRFAACTFVECVCDAGRPRNSWGVAPNPSRGAAPAPCKGHCPLTLFLRPGLVAFPYNKCPGSFSLSGRFLYPFPYSSGFSTRIIRSITG